GRMHPAVRQILRDRMHRGGDAQIEIVSRPMSRRQTAARWNRDDAGAIVANREARTEAGLSPAEANHLVVRRPLQKRVVGRVKDDHAATALDIALERLLALGGPAQSIGLVSAVEVH